VFAGIPHQEEEMKNKISLAIRGGLAVTLTALLVACGGGGGGGGATLGVQGPPTAATVLTGAGSDATAGTEAAITSAAAAAERAGTLGGLNVVLGQPLAASRTTGREQALINETAPCTDFVDPPCSGTVTISSSLDENATVAPAGTIIDIGFTALNGNFFGTSVSLNGAMSIKFLDAFDFDANFSGLRIELTTSALGGTVNGVDFGPLSDLAEFSISASGASTVTAGGRRYSALDSVQFDGPDDYSLSGGVIRTAYTSSSGTFVDITIHNLRVVNGRPQVGSNITVTASNGSIGLQVTATSAAEVVYSASLNVGGTLSAYVVTASYPSGGGQPTYSAVPA
jgi:hypothetical protein